MEMKCLDLIENSNRPRFVPQVQRRACLDCAITKSTRKMTSNVTNDFGSAQRSDFVIYLEERPELVTGRCVVIAFFFK